MKKYSLYVSGTHCPSCKILIEETINEHELIDCACVDLSAKTVEIETDKIETHETLVDLLNPLLSSHGYKLTIERENKEKKHKELLMAIFFGMFVLFLFFLLQKSGIINFGFEGGLTPWTALFIGLIASVSTCLAVVGGLILSLSAKMSHDGFSFKPFSLFHVGRVFGFVLLGALLGFLGDVISINYGITSFLGLLASLVMIILGINLLDVFDFGKKLQFVLPKISFQKMISLENGFFTPFLTGVATFFLPCGFTQSMQIASLASGSWIQGAMIMLMFSLGTLPMLLLISISSYRFAKSPYATIFFKSAGVVVIGLGIFAFLSGLAGLGLINPLFNI